METGATPVLHARSKLKLERQRELQRQGRAPALGKYINFNCQSKNTTFLLFNLGPPVYFANASLVQRKQRQP
jgi:hypothetical protein